MLKVTTAQLRKQAEIYEEARRYGTAARLYDLAADRYPLPAGELAKVDIAGLRARAKYCRSAKAAA